MEQVCSTAFRISSLGSLIAFTAAPVIAWTLVPSYMLGVMGMSVLLIARHKNNIKALLKGEAATLVKVPSPLLRINKSTGSQPHLATNQSTSPSLP